MSDEVLTNDIFKELEKLDGGNLGFNFSQEFSKVLEKVKEHGAKGSISLSITIVPEPQFGETAIKVTPEIKTQIPKKKAQFAMRFISGKNTIEENDPNQLTFKGFN